ncbi:hypothetical protein CLAFUW4_03726 [Fulvia fulva]|uniref:Uncharacterized protein n=1 Tax=Passalora fulva TaxID=5499 RepID=A0A9Q8P4U0_PASFU|nr:uncharacterized protein CLAFUR5_03701 [Fulvia fulva]KAK4631567.1 hypothetical protein CLAFUR4_03714 [Fulvia fulva]KAK4633813.1 hypothetical protein CLAFUR0_03715 [Fulvia fulva]UJO13318.1 hypothetical protein CLAFUR5_03701 [Fulvia fulva]WPV10960.1 hypothetical protein CLAFUW4_03726 [Fulvia fulva]WPV26244.1 hypothetical protein CLAFUW7_03718 [Fulvia fulva]
MEQTTIALLILLYATQIMASESATVNTFSATLVKTGPAPTGPNDHMISHLSQGARAGISTSAIFGAILLFGIAFFVWKRMKKARMERASQERYLELQTGGPHQAAFSQASSLKPAGSVPGLHLPLAHIQRSKELDD